VLRAISRGLSNQQIADELVISVRTVERHINHIYEKLGVHSKAQATAYALRKSLA
jgi:DNA-binding NarL/FixJ family response regulator